MKKEFALTLGCLLLAFGVAAAAFTRDGGIIRQSGSTNTKPFVIKVWSDSNAAVTVGDAQARAFVVPTNLTALFFRQVRAARANPGAEGQCMKSASFGTTTHVAWHNYTTTDLQCTDGATAEVTALAATVARIVELANVGSAPRRIPNPNYMKRAPVEGPASPTPKATP